MNRISKTPLKALDSNSPVKASDVSKTPKRLSPTKQRFGGGIPSMRSSPNKSSFTIFSDESAKENIPPSGSLSPPKNRFPKLHQTKTPLREISSLVASGFITVNDTTVQLVHNWNPSKSKTRASLKYRNLPNYVTPPRKSLLAHNMTVKVASTTPEFKHFDIYEDKPEPKQQSNSSILFGLEDNKENIPPKFMI